MRKTCLYIVTALASLWALSCNRTADPEEEKVAARAAGNILYESELAHLFTAPMSEEDSIALAESYVDMWIKKQLKVKEAENIFSGTTQEIDRLVEEYRNSLLIHRLEQYYVDTMLDTLDSESSISQYYAEHRAEYLLDRPIVKGAIVRVPENYRQKEELKELMTGNGDRYQDFIDTSLKNDLELYEFDTWTDLSHFVAVLPAAREEDAQRILDSTGVEEMKDGSDVWYIYVTDRMQAGDPSPLERVNDLIARVLFNQRKQEIIRSVEDSIYRTAMRRKEIEINL